MRYSGGGIGHQHESSRWKSADRGLDADEINVDSEPEDGMDKEDGHNVLAKLHTLDETLNHLPANEDEGAETDDSDSTDSNSSNSTLSHVTDDDEDDRAYFGPEDTEPIFDSDSDDI